MARNHTALTPHEVEQLKLENYHLKKQNGQKEDENRGLKQELQASTRFIHELLGIIDSLKEENGKLVSEKKWLFRRINKLKRKECEKNCVACTMLWICETEKLGLGVDLCIRQLEKIITVHAGEKIEKDDLKCEQLMEILKKCELVSVEVEYKYPPELNDKLRVIDEVWDKLMRTDGSVRIMILGRVISVANDEGHAEICDLDTRTFDGKVTIHNPQQENWGHGNREDFKKYVIKDEGLILYMFHLEKLKEIIRDHEHILHRTGPSNQSLVLGSGAIDGVPE